MVGVPVCPQRESSYHTTPMRKRVSHVIRGACARLQEPTGSKVVLRRNFYTGNRACDLQNHPIQNPEMYKIRNRIEWSAGMVVLEPRAGVKRNGDRFTLSLGRLGGCGVPGVRNVLRPPSSRTFRATHHALPRAVLNLIRCDRHPLAIDLRSGGKKVPQT